MPFDTALAQSLYAHVPLATFVVDVDPAAAPDHRFRYTVWNPSCARSTGLAETEALNRTPRELVPWLSEADARAVEARYQRCVDGGAPMQYEEHLVMDGRPTCWLTSLTPVADADGVVRRLIGMSDEMTSYKRLERCLAEEEATQARFARRLRQLHRLSTSSYPSAALLFQDYLDTGSEIFGLPRGIISRIEDGVYTVRRAIWPGDELCAGTALALGGTLCAEVAASGQTVQHHDLGLSRRLYDHPAHREEGVAAYISTPIRVRGAVYGTLSFCSEEARSTPFSEQDVELIELMADGIGHFLELEHAREEAEGIRREMETARDEAEAANRAKTAFLSTMSHEIRTPLTGVLGFAALLRLDAELPERQRHYAEIIERSGEQLVSLVNDVLDLARIEADALTLHPEPVDVAALVRESLSVHAATADARGIEMGYEIEPGVPAHVLADGRRLGQVLGNLVSNAAKFTREGRVAVRVSADARQAPAGRLVLRVEVEDTGHGIDAAALPHVFDAFYQADGAARTHAGTGLGLAICQRLVRAMDGAISADSALGRGTTITFTAEVGVQAKRHVVAAARPAAQLSGRRALVLVPDAANRELLEALLRPWGMAVTTAATGREALHLVATQAPFDVALVEHNLPDETGADVARQLGMRGETMPVLLLSAQDDARAVAEPNILGVLRKPLDTQALRRALQQAVATDSVSLAAPAPILPIPLPDAVLVPAPVLFSHPTSRPDVPAVLAATDRALTPALRVLVAEDDPTNRDLIQLMLSGLGVRPDFAANGAALLARLDEDAGYDLIFMDVMMPVMDGMEAAREVIARHGDDRPRMVALTAQALQEERKRILAAGLDAFIPKPFSREDLRQALESTPRRETTPTLRVSVTPQPQPQCLVEAS